MTARRWWAVPMIGVGVLGAVAAVFSELQNGDPVNERLVVSLVGDIVLNPLVWVGFLGIYFWSSDRTAGPLAASYRRSVASRDSSTIPTGITCWNCGASASAAQAECDICKAGLRPLNPDGIGLGVPEPATDGDRFYCNDCKMILTSPDRHESNGHNVRPATQPGRSNASAVSAAEEQASRVERPISRHPEPQPLSIVARPQIRSLEPMEDGLIVSVILSSAPSELWIQTFRDESRNLGIVFSAADLSIYVPGDADIQLHLNSLSDAIDRANQIDHDRWTEEQDGLAAPSPPGEIKVDPRAQAIDDWWHETAAVEEQPAQIPVSDPGGPAAPRTPHVGSPASRMPGVPMRVTGADGLPMLDTELDSAGLELVQTARRLSYLHTFREHGSVSIGVSDDELLDAGTLVGQWLGAVRNVHQMDAHAAAGAMTAWKEPWEEQSRISMDNVFMFGSWYLWPDHFEYVESMFDTFDVAARGFECLETNRAIASTDYPIFESYAKGVRTYTDLMAEENG